MSTVKELLAKRRLIPCPVVYDGLTARVLEKTGYELAYIGGSNLAASDFAVPDMGLLTLTEVLERARNIVRAVNIPVICDVDTGFGGINMARRTITEFEAAGVSGVQIEDQTSPSRAESIEGKAVIPVEQFVAKLRAVVEARRSENFVIIGRTDSKETLGMDEVIRRLNIYADNGADLAMSGSPHTFEEHKRIAKEVKIPVMANCHINQIGAPLTKWEETGVKLVGFMFLPLFAVMKAITKSMQMLKTKGTVAEMADELATLEDRREILKIDEWLKWAEK